MSDDIKRPEGQPPEQQDQRPGVQAEMKQQPWSESPTHKGSGKLKGKVALITGGDSGIGRAIAVAFAKEGAKIANVFLEEHEDAKETQKLVEEQGGEYVGWAGDLGDEKFCQQVVKNTIDKYGQLDVLVNNAAEQHPQEKIEDITAEQLERTFRSNIFSMFYLTKAAMPHLKKGGVIINTTSVTAYQGNPQLLDYSSTKGAIRAFTYSLALNVADKGIRVNAVAPGPIWTPLIPSTFPPDKVESFGGDTSLGRAGQPEEVAMAYVYLASGDSSFVTGQVIHVNGGQIING
jgi:NAD(P)-dependent dehydrogenase (short-subunit alcohol dehydrogenase family)